MWHGNTLMEESDNLSEETKDDRTTTSTHMADSMINICIVNVEEDMSTSYCIFIIMLASFLIYLCWPIFLYGFVLYQLITYDNPSDRKSSVHRGSWSSPCLLCGLRDAQIENRVDQPTDHNIDFIPVPLDVQNIQVNDPIVFPDFDDDQRTDQIAADMPNETNLPPTTGEDTTQALVIAMIGLTRFLNPHFTISLRNNAYSMDNSEGEDPNNCSESENESDNEYDSSNDVERRGEASPTPHYHSNHVQNHAHAEQIDIVSNIPIVNRDFGLVQYEARDKPINVKTTDDDDLQGISASIHSTSIVISKTKLSLPLHEVFDNGQTFE